MTLQQRKKHSRKWKVFRIRFVIDILTVGTGLILAVRNGGIEVLAAGFADMSLNVGTYFTANVVQHRNESEFYRPEMVEGS